MVHGKTWGFRSRPRNGHGPITVSLSKVVIPRLRLIVTLTLQIVSTSYNNNCLQIIIVIEFKVARNLLLLFTFSKSIKHCSSV